MYKAIERLRCIEKGTVDITAVASVIIDSLFEAVDGMRSRRLLFKSKLVLGRR